MNFPNLDNISGRQRCRTWTPLLTQQLRLRHLYQVIAYNVSHEVSDGLYYTLHTTAMCAPFYTSEKVVSQNPKWIEIEIDDNQTNSASTALVLRIWQQSEIILTWGINLSGLLYLGNKLSDVQPESFMDNTVILYLRGGYFTGVGHVRFDVEQPDALSANLNVIRDDPDDRRLYRIARLEFPAYEVRGMYDVEKLRKLHSMQIAIKNKSLDVGYLRDTINSRDGLINGNGDATSSKTEDDVPVDTTVRYAPQLLTMTSLNKMLQEKPTKVQKQEIVRVKKEIENCKLKSKILLQERERKQASLRLLKNQYKELVEMNEEKSSDLMEDYRCLSKDVEKLREWKREHQNQKECLLQLTRKLHNRRRQLMSELLLLYPVEKMNEKKYTINGIYLPSSDMLTDCSDGGLSVALGYVAHALIMCASFLQVPLRYPIHHMGSRSMIEDHVTTQYWDKNREFPLYTRGKDRLQFNYAIYLLNKNIAQYLYLLGARTPDLRETLPNVIALLQGKEHRQEQEHKAEIVMRDNVSVYSEDLLRSDREYYRNDAHKVLFESVQNIPDPILDCLKYECQAEKMKSSPKHGRKSAVKEKGKEPGQSLSQILAIPEAFMSQQMSSSVFKNYMNSSIDTFETSTSTSSNTDCIPPTNCDKHTDSNNAIEIAKPEKSLGGNNNQLSRSVGSCIDQPKPLQLHNLELGSDPLINMSGCSKDTVMDRSCASDGSADASHQAFLQNWAESGTEASFYEPEEKATTACDDSPLTTRTDALLKTKSFNLVKPKL